MQQANGTRAAVGEPDRAAIGDIDRKHHPSLIRQQAIDSGDCAQAIGCDDLRGPRHHRDGMAMNLLGTPPSGITAGKFIHSCLMKRAQMTHRLVAIASKLEPGNTLDPRGANAGDRMDRIKKRKHLRHRIRVREVMVLRQATLCAGRSGIRASAQCIVRPWIARLVCSTASA